MLSLSESSCKFVLAYWMRFLALTVVPSSCCLPVPADGRFRYFHFQPDGGDRTIKHDDVVHIKSVSKSSTIAMGIVAKAEGNRQPKSQNQPYIVRVKVTFKTMHSLS